MELNLKKSNWRKVRFGDVVKKVTNKTYVLHLEILKNLKLLRLLELLK